MLLSSTTHSACKMANSDPVNANGSTKNCEMTKSVKELMIRITSLEQTVKCQEDTILILNKNVDELQNRMSAQEKYSIKDCLIFKNFPINPFSKTYIMFAKQFTITSMIKLRLIESRHAIP